MVWQYLNGHRPLNLQAAVKFAKGLGVQLHDFSPRLAAQAKAATLGTSEPIQAREPEPRSYAPASAHAQGDSEAEEGAVLAQLLRQAAKEDRHRIIDELRMLVVKSRAGLSPEELARCLDALDRLESTKPTRPTKKAP
jgi:hypothetical protein